MATLPPEPSNPHPLRLLLAGRTGNGKSATRNSILGVKKFTPTSSITNDIHKPTEEECRIGVTTVAVVDGVEIDDYTDKVKATSSMADEAFSLCPEGFSALLIFLKYGVCFTKQEQDAAQMIKSVFGEDVVESHGIVVMTHGDNFDMDFEDEEMSFDDWCREQVGNIKSLYEETCGRWVLFDNKTKDEEKKRNQVTTLLSLVEAIQISHGSFGRREAPPSKTTTMQIETTQETPESNVKTGEKDFGQDHVASNQNIAGRNILVKGFSWPLYYVREIFGLVKSHAFQDSDKTGEAETIIKEILQTLQEIDDKTCQTINEELEHLKSIKNHVAYIEKQYEQSADIEKLRPEISCLKSRIDSSIRRRETFRDHDLPKTEKPKDATPGQGSDLQDTKTASDLSTKAKVVVEVDQESCTVQETTHCPDVDRADREKNLQETFVHGDVKTKENNQQEPNSTKKMKFEEERDVQSQCQKTATMNEFAHQQVHPGSQFDLRARQEANGSSYCEAGDQNQAQRERNPMSSDGDNMGDCDANSSSLDYESFVIIEYEDLDDKPQ